MCNNNDNARQNNANAREVLFGITVEQIKEVYSGAHGCACGCRGNYSETPRQIKATFTKAKRLVADEGATVWMSSDQDGNPLFVVIDTDTRTHTLYFTK